MTSTDLCCCDSLQPYGDCCAPFHEGRQHPPTALDLMRSRYSAYALGKVDYVMQTTHRENPQYRANVKAWRQDLLKYCASARFLELSILNFEPGEQSATVTFQAKMLLDGGPVTLAETSRFAKVGQRWLYHSGDTDFS